MNIYNELDYREIIEKRVIERRKAGIKLTFQELSEACRIPKSYLSKVLGGGANLSQDQLYTICCELGFSAKERHYIALLLEYERSGVSTRSRELKDEIMAIQQKQLDTKEHIKYQESAKSLDEIASYYLDPQMQIIHAALSIDKYRADPRLLTEKLGMTPEKLSSILSQLERLRIISISADKISVRSTSLHLPKDSPIYPPWRNLMRLASLKRLEAETSTDTYNYSVTFSCDETTRIEIQRRFLEFLKGAQDLVANAKEENVYQINFDLFSWL